MSLQSKIMKSTMHAKKGMKALVKESGMPVHPILKEGFAAEFVDRSNFLLENLVICLSSAIGSLYKARMVNSDFIYSGVPETKNEIDIQSVKFELIFNGDSVEITNVADSTILYGEMKDVASDIKTDINTNGISMKPTTVAAIVNPITVFNPFENNVVANSQSRRENAVLRDCIFSYLRIAFMRYFIPVLAEEKIAVSIVPKFPVTQEDMNDGNEVGKIYALADANDREAVNQAANDQQAHIKIPTYIVQMSLMR